MFGQKSNFFAISKYCMNIYNVSIITNHPWLLFVIKLFNNCIKRSNNFLR